MEQIRGKIYFGSAKRELRVTEGTSYPVSCKCEMQKLTCKLLCREDLKYCVTQKRIIKHNSPNPKQGPLRTDYFFLSLAKRRSFYLSNK